MAVILNLKTCAGLILYTYLYCRLLTYTYPKQASKLLAKIMKRKQKFDTFWNLDSQLDLNNNSSLM